MFSRFVMLAAVVLALLSARPADADTVDSAKQFVADRSARAITAMTGAGMPESERREQFRVLFVEAVDLPAVGKFVLGRFWRVATPAQRHEFLALFEDVLVYSWANRFSNTAGGVRLQINDAMPDAGQGVRVESVIIREKQDPVPLVWRLRPADGGWRVIDLIAEGASMVATYRDDYASVIAQGGGSVDVLIDALRRKVAQLSASGH